MGGVRIVIASTAWREISMQLLKEGLIPLRDFVPCLFYEKAISYVDIVDFMNVCNIREINYDLLMQGKKIAVLYGNCQTSMLENMMCLNSNFTEQYLIIKVLKVPDWEADNGKLRKYMFRVLEDYKFLQRIDLFIYQTVSRTNEIAETLCTDLWIENLRNDCQKCKILNLYFKGYFPQNMDTRTERILLNESGLFPNGGDRYIDNLLKQGKDENEIIENIQNEEFLDKNIIQKNIEDSLNELIKREQMVDIKISDYILKNYAEKQLWYSFNHPCEELLLEYMYRILDWLKVKKEKISKTDVVLLCGTLKGQDIPIYPCVIKYLGLKEYEQKYLPNRYIYNNLLLTLEEYIKLYLIYCKNGRKIQLEQA